MCMCARLNCSLAGWLDPLLIHCVCFLCAHRLSLEGENKTSSDTVYRVAVEESSAGGERWRTVTPRWSIEIGEWEWVKSFGVCVVVHTLPCKHELRKLLFWRCCQHSSIPVSLPYAVLCIEVLLLHCVPMRSHEAFNSYLHSSIAFLSTVYTHTSTSIRQFPSWDLTFISI